jgi:hypothetical protein
MVALRWLHASGYHCRDFQNYKTTLLVEYKIPAVRGADGHGVVPWRREQNQHDAKPGDSGPAAAISFPGLPALVAEGGSRQPFNDRPCAGLSGLSDLFSNLVE